MKPLMAVLEHGAQLVPVQGTVSHEFTNWLSSALVRNWDGTITAVASRPVTFAQFRAAATTLDCVLACRLPFQLRRCAIPRLLQATILALIILMPASTATRPSKARRRPTIYYFIATAYSVEGAGASGKWSHPGTVAADRNILPLNTRIRIYGAGKYSGEYTVEDTGAKVDGHHIDVYMPSRAEAKKFGRQRVKVVVLKFGDDEASPPDPAQKARAKAVNRRVRARSNPSSN
jgi:3D (Asp-Asp-Asp) domain-containing protein